MVELEDHYINTKLKIYRKCQYNTTNINTIHFSGAGLKSVMSYAHIKRAAMHLQKEWLCHNKELYCNTELKVSMTYYEIYLDISKMHNLRKTIRLFFHNC